MTCDQLFLQGFARVSAKVFLYKSWNSRKEQPLLKHYMDYAANTFERREHVLVKEN